MAKLNTKVVKPADNSVSASGIPMVNNLLMREKLSFGLTNFKLDFPNKKWNKNAIQDINWEAPVANAAPFIP